jgi:transposase InsO family protein
LELDGGLLGTEKRFKFSRRLIVSDKVRYRVREGRVVKKIQLIITARTGNKLLPWQFDRGSEFLNAIFEQRLLLELGVEQRFSNVDHPWENGKAERSFQTIFGLARSLLKHADLPIKMWGKAILH